MQINFGGGDAGAAYRGATVGSTWRAKAEGTAPLHWLIWSSLTPTDGMLTLTQTPVGRFAMVDALRLGDAMSTSGAQAPGPAAGLLLLGAAARRPRAG